MSGEEADRLLESVEDAGDFFVRKEAGKSEAGVIVDGDVQAFHAGTWIAASAIAGGTDAGLREAAQLLDVEVKEFAGLGAFVAQTGWARFSPIDPPWVLVLLFAALGTVGFYVAYRFAEDYLLVSRIMGKAVQVPAAVTVYGDSCGLVAAVSVS